MKKSSMTLLSLIALSSSSFGDSAASMISGSADSAGTYQSSDRGLVNNLALCTYELCHLDEAGRLRISPVAAGSTSAIVAQASVPNAQKYLVFYPVSEQRNPDARHILRNRYVITLAEGATLEDVQNRCGIQSAKLVAEGSNLVICEEESSGKVLAQLSNVKSDPGVVSVEPLFTKKRVKRDLISEPFYDTLANPLPPRADGNYQWYLNNIGINGGVADVDINLEPALFRATGIGINVAIVDDGVSIDHVDLAANSAAGPHFNLLDGELNDPTTFDDTLTHGTGIAALIGADFNNSVGMSGVAPRASLSGIRLFGADGLTDDADEAQALLFENDVIDIYNAGWGPDDTTLDLDGPGPLTLAALQNGAERGRSGPATPANPNPLGLGNIFVWGAGNGALIGDNSNYDGYANSKFTIAVGAVADSGRRAPYSEPGANLVVVAPSSGGAQDILTASYGLDVDEDDNPIRTSEHVTDFGGTSAAAALVSGVAALMLEENPTLTWREVQDILIRTAVEVDPGPEWETNAAGISFNHNYGAGLVDAGAAVQEAFRYGQTPAARLGPAVRHVRSQFFTNDANDPTETSGIIPDNTGGSLLVGFDMTEDFAGANLANLRVEHVELNATIVTESRSDLEIVLISPNGTLSFMQEVAPDHDEQSIRRWTFMTVRNWGEGSAGTWVVRITDRITGDQAVLNNASLIINGSVDPLAPVNQIPILTSSRVINADQGSSLTYSLETSGATGVAVSDLPDGLVYDSVNQTISGAPTTPGLYSIRVVLTDANGVEGVFFINVVVRPTAVALGDAVGLSGIPAVFGGDAPWDFELTDTNDGNSSEPRSARSAVGLGDGQQSIFGFDGLASGVLLFDWKTSSQEGADRLWFNLGGDVPQIWKAFISGEREWGRVAVHLPDSSNDVRWIYSKDEAEGEGEDRGLVDNVELITFEKYREDVYRAANVQGIDLEFDSRCLFLPYEFAGGSPSTDGAREVLRSSTVGNGQTVSMAAWLTGPGLLSFRAFNPADVSDLFEVLIDGVVTSTLPGSGSGTGPVSNMLGAYDIPEGRHRLQLRFRKDFRGSDARVLIGDLTDGVLIDDLSFTPQNNFNTFVSQYGSGFDPNPEADPDGDGYSNHNEYAFGGNMASADIPKYLPQVVEDGGRSYIEYGIDPSRADLTYEPQQSPDLENWGPAQLASLVRVEGDYEVYRIPVSSVQGRRHLFYRVVARTK